MSAEKEKYFSILRLTSAGVVRAGPARWQRPGTRGQERSKPLTAEAPVIVKTAWGVEWAGRARLLGHGPAPAVWGVTPRGRRGRLSGPRATRRVPGTPTAPPAPR